MVDGPMRDLGSHPAVLLVIFGVIIWGDWVLARAGFKAHERSIDTYEGEIRSANERAAAAEESAKAEVRQAKSDADLQIEEEKRKAQYRINMIETKNQTYVEAAEQRAEMKIIEAAINLETAGYIKAKEAIEERDKAKSRIHELEAIELELSEKLKVPTADDQALFDRILAELPEGSGRLGWLFIGKFNGKSWVRSDMSKISDFTDAYEKQEFRDPVVQEAWRNLWCSMNKFWRRALGERSNGDVSTGNGDFYYQIRTDQERGEDEPTYQQTVVLLMDMVTDIFSARQQLIEVATKRNFNREVLIPNRGSIY